MLFLPSDSYKSAWAPPLRTNLDGLTLLEFEDLSYVDGPRIVTRQLHPRSRFAAA